MKTDPAALRRNARDPPDAALGPMSWIKVGHGARDMYKVMNRHTPRHGRKSCDDSYASRLAAGFSLCGVNRQGAGAKRIPSGPGPDGGSSCLGGGLGRLGRAPRAPWTGQLGLRAACNGDLNTMAHLAPRQAEC